MSLDNLSNITLSSNLEMQPTTQPKQKEMKSQNDLHTRDPKHITMSNGIAQFLLDDLLNNDTLNESHKLKIDNMKSAPKWTFFQIYAACKNKSISINDSALENVNKIITECENMDSLKTCDCLGKMRYPLQRITRFLQICDLNASYIKRIKWMKLNCRKSKQILLKKKCRS